MSLVVGTAGHIDHGKTTLLRALTGIDADRLPEERRRGMTIDVGYAHLELENGAVIDFVDVPGHDALVGNMLVGAGEIDAAMLVVAADDGPRAQTLEHLELLDALGVAVGIAVVTKADLSSSDRVAEVRAEVAALLARSSLAGAPILAVSGLTGQGLDEVRVALAGLAARRAAGPAVARGMRLPIDRAFGVRGRGAVVTGTLRGSLSVGEPVRVLPADLAARVRGIQQRGRPVEVVGGGRTAINLAGLELGDLRRGLVVVGGGADVVATDRLLVSLRPPIAWPGRRPPLSPRVGETLRIHAGTAQAGARVRAFGPGSDIRLLILDRPTAVAAGDRFVLRRPAPDATAAGGLVVDARPPRGVARRRATRGRLEALRDAVAAGGPGALASDAASRTELHGALVEDGKVRFAADVAAALDAAAVAEVRAHHDAEPDSAGLPVGALRLAVARAARRLATLDVTAASIAAEIVVAGLIERTVLARDADRVRVASQRAGPSAGLAAAMDRLEAVLAVAAPPPLAEAAAAAGCPPDGIRLLTTSGRITRLEADLAWATPTYQRLAATALALARRGPLTPAAFRDASGSSRRYALAILEDLDRRGVLRRGPDGHVPGPRAPRPA